MNEKIQKYRTSPRNRAGIGRIPIGNSVSSDTSTKFRYFSIPNLFCSWLACMYENLKKMSIKAKKKLKNTNFFLEVCLMELDQVKIINCVPERILHTVVQNHFCKDIVSQ